jgi:hypothetical protein
LIKYQKIKAKDVISLNAWRTPDVKQKTAALARFHVDIGSEIPINEQQTARFIIATSSAISLGLTLTEAISVSFLEPGYHPSKITQGFGRHCRQGNRNKMVYCNIFMVLGNKVEEKIMGISRIRKQILEVQNRKVREVIQLEE